jgi:site-specific DNA-methyltransferase (adenine-specific)
VSTVELYNGDCLEVMRGMPSGSVDAVVTDPPYEQSHSPLAESKARLKGNHTPDKLIEHGWVYDHAWLQEVARILKAGGGWYAFMNDEGWSSLKLQAKELGLFPHGRLVWVKTNSMPSLPRKKYRSSTELIMYGNKGGHVRYFGATNQQDIVSHFSYPIVGGKQRTAHPTQKPLGMFTTFVLHSCPPDGTVLDPFMGSGTTGVACINTGRNFVGIELDKGYFEIAQKRIEAAQQVQRLDLQEAS